MTKLLATF